MTLDNQLSAAKRELALRKSVYPKWVASGRMSHEKAAYEISAMEAIVETLETVSILDQSGLAWVISADRTKNP